MTGKKAIALRLALIVALVAIFLNALYFVSKKEDYFLDEKWTFFFANCYIVTFPELISELKDNNFDTTALYEKFSDRVLVTNGKVRTLDDINAMMDAQMGNGFTPFSSFLASTRDSHPPLYYLIFNFINSFIKGISVKYTGFIINIVALLFTCIMIYKITSLFQGEICALAAVLFYGLSYEFINNVTYFRMYALFTLWITLLLYLYLKWSQSGYSYDEKKYLRAICLVELIAMFTQYLAAVYILPLFIVTVVFLKTNKISPKRYIIKHVIIAVIYTVLWPFSVFRFIFDESGQDVRETFSLLNIPYRVAQYVRVCVDSLFAGSKIYFLGVAVLIAVYILWAIIKLIRQGKFQETIHSKSFEYYVYLIIPGALFYVVVADIAPWAVDRYMMPVIGVVSVVIMVFLWQSLKWILKREWICAAVMALVIAISYYVVLGMYPHYLYPSTNEKQAFIQNYTDKTAAIIEPDDQMEFVDTFLSVEHPYWIIVNRSGLEKCLLENANSLDSMVFYVNRFCDTDDVLNTIEANGGTLTKSDYETDFYDIYYFSR